jgi:hypothetical protein
MSAGMFWMPEHGEAEHRVHRGQPGVAGPRAVVVLLSEVFEEGADQRRVEVLELQPGGWPAGLAVGEGEQQVRTCRGRRRSCAAGLALADQPLGVKRL